MKKLFVLIALGGMGSFAVGCGEPATPPAPPANPANSPGHAMHMEMMKNKANAGHDAAGEKKGEAAKDDAAPSDEAAPDKEKKDGE